VVKACPPNAAQVIASAGSPSEPVGSKGPKIRTIEVEFGGFISKRQAINRQRVVGFGKIDPIV
jgi:hypothetical protein